MGKCVNLFAAELVFDNVVILAALNRDNTFVTAVAELMRPAELRDFKFCLLKWNDHQMAAYPSPARSNFLRDAETLNGESWYSW